MSETFNNKGNSIEHGTENSRLAESISAIDSRQPFIDEFAASLPALSNSGITALRQSELLHCCSSNSKTTNAAMPDTVLGRASVIGKEAALAFPGGVAESLLGIDHISIPYSQKLLGKDLTLPVPAILENAAVGAAIGFGARTLLPQTGILGKVGNAVLAGVFLAPVASTSYKIFNDVRFANNMQDLQLAGKELGATLGAFTSGLPVGIAGYKLGEGLGGKLMSTETMAPFAKAKGKFYDALNQKLSGTEASADALNQKLSGTDTSADALKTALQTKAEQSSAIVEPRVEKTAELRTDLQGAQLALYKEFKPALERYHTGGLSNGGGVDGIQLPPKVSEAELQLFIHKLSQFLAEEPGIDVKEPAPGQSAEDFRSQLERQSADAVKANRQLYLSTALKMIENPTISGMIQEALQQAPSEFFSAPSSSSGKYHPADEVNVGGLSLHSLRDVKMGAKLIDFYNKDAGVNVVGNQNIIGDQRDLILGSLLVHDIEKGGIPWNKYDPAHGPEGATYLESVWQNTPHTDFALKMQELVNNHMAQWNKAPGNISDPKPPQNIPNQIVSYADYLGSQPHVFVQPFPGLDD